MMPAALVAPIVHEYAETGITMRRDGWLASETARKAGRWPAEPPCSNSGRERSERSARLADDQRDVALGAALVTAIAPVGRHHPGPQRRLFLRRRPAGPHRPAPAGHGQLDLGIGHQVAVPVRVTVISAL